jgi:hypothetical protein
MLCRLLWMGVLVAACVSPLAAGTYYVGTCHAGSFATISAAVSSPQVASGSTIKVCPGTYPEQVIISKPLTLQGMVSQTGSGALILGPTLQLSDTFQLATSAVFGVSFYPFVWVTTGPVKIQNLSVDDWVYQNSTLGWYVGFYYASGAFGSLTNVASHEDMVGSSVWAENANTTATLLTITGSFFDNGIIAIATPPPAGHAPVLTTDISGNQVSPNWGTSSGSYGVYLSEVGGTVSGNSIYGPKLSRGNLFPFDTFGIYDNAPAVTVSGNSIMFTPTGAEFHVDGIYILADDAVVKSNKIGGAENGIVLNCHTATVSGNTITFSDFGNGGYGVGVLDAPAGFAGVNTFHNTVVNMKSSCP